MSIKKITIALNPRTLADAELLAAIELSGGSPAQALKLYATRGVHADTSISLTARAFEIRDEASKIKGKGFDLAKIKPKADQSPAAAPAPAPIAPTPVQPVVTQPVPVVQPAVAPTPVQVAPVQVAPAPITPAPITPAPIAPAPVVQSAPIAPTHIQQPTHIQTAPAPVAPTQPQPQPQQPRSISPVDDLSNF